MFKKENLRIFIVGGIIACLFQIAMYLLPNTYTVEGEIIEIVERTMDTSTVHFPTVGEPRLIKPESNTFKRYHLTILFANYVIDCPLTENNESLINGSNHVEVTYEIMDTGEFRCIDVNPSVVWESM